MLCLIKLLIHGWHKHIFVNPHLRIHLLVLEGGRVGGVEGERERNTDVTEKQGSVASHMRPDQGSNPQCRYVP